MSRAYFRHQSGRMFDNAFLEACSRVHPSVPFVFYLPPTLALFAWGLLEARTTVLHSALFLPLGLLTWIALEYVLHRFLFHWEGSGPFTRKLHDIVHGYHHRYPDDVQRLVMPLGASLPLALVLGGLLWLAERPAMTIPYFCGVVWGYLFYDFAHWSTHHRTPRTRWGKMLRARHMAHHFATPDRNFSISHPWVDSLLGTAGRHPSSRQPSGALDPGAEIGITK